MFKVLKPEQSPSSSNAPQPQDEMPFIPGDIGELQSFIMDFADYQSSTIAFVGALSIYSGIVGGGYVTTTSGYLNTYNLLLAPTGHGKNIVKKARAALYDAIAASGNKAVTGTIGPGQIASGPGLIRWLQSQPVCLSILSEFGPTLKKITCQNVNVNDEGIRKELLTAYDAIFEPTAYADETKNTKSLTKVAFSIFAESNPNSIFEVYDDSLITTGLLPRFDVYEVTGNRPYYNKGKINSPPASLVTKMSDVSAYALSRTAPIMPTFGLNAEAKLTDFERFITDTMNASANSEITKQLYNRANFKAHKLATLRAVSENYLKPVITLDNVMWATNLQVNLANAQIAKFESGEVGGEAGNETKQQNEVLLVINRYIRREYSYSVKYHGDSDMHHEAIITLAHIQQRAGKLACFRNDRLGATNAIKRTVKNLDDANIIQQVSTKQMAEMFSSKAVAYHACDLKALVKELDRRGLGQR